MSREACSPGTHLWRVLVTAGTLALTCATQPLSAHEGVSVERAIEWTRFASSRGKALVLSPDGSHGAVVLETPSIAQNAVHSRLVIVDVGGLLRLQHLDQRSASAYIKHGPEFASTSNDAGIRDLQWSRDGRDLYFIGERPDTRSQVFRYRTLDDTVTQITTAANGVLAFAAGESTVVFAAKALQGERWFTQSAAHGYVVEGWETFAELYNPRNVDLDWIPDFEIFVTSTSGGTAQPVEVKTIRQTPASIRFWMSPDDRFVVAELRVTEIPGSWAKLPGFMGARLRPTPSGSMPRHGFKTELVLVDTHARTARRLTGGPTAPTLGYAFQQPEVVWSRDGRTLVVAGSLLDPANWPDFSANSARTPLIVHVDALSGHIEPVAFVGHTDDDNGAVVMTETWGLALHGEEITINRAERLMGTAAERSARHGATTLRFRKRHEVWAEIRREAALAEGRGAVLPGVELMVHQDNNSPPKLMAVRSRDRQRAVILDPNADRFADLPQWQPIEWSAKGGKPWKGGLLLPKVGRAPFPLVIQTHGFSADMFLVAGPFTTAYAAQPLASLGFAVLQVPDDVATIASADPLVAAREAEIHLAGYEGAIEHLAALGLVDPAKVGAIGFSRTCYHVNYALVFSRFPLKAAVCSDGTDVGYGQYLAWAAGMDPAWTEMIETRNGGVPFEGALTRWAETLPHYHLDRVRGALRTEVLSEHKVAMGWEMHAGLRRLGLPSELVIYSQGAHELFKPEQRLSSMQGTVDWMRFWLKGEEDPSDGKAAQYRRWHHLRDEQTRAMRASAGRVSAQGNAGY